VGRITSAVDDIKTTEIFFNPRTEANRLKMGNSFPDWKTMLKDMPFWHIDKYAEVRQLLAAGWDTWVAHVAAHQDNMKSLAVVTGQPLEYITTIKGQPKAMAWDDHTMNLLAFRRVDVIVLEAGTPDLALRAKGFNPARVVQWATISPESKVQALVFVGSWDGVESLEQICPGVWQHKVWQHYFSDADPWTSEAAGRKLNTPWVGGKITVMSRNPIKAPTCPYVATRELMSGLRPSMFSHILGITAIAAPLDPAQYNCCLYIPDRRRTPFHTMLSVAGCTFHIGRWQFEAAGLGLRANCSPGQAGKYMQAWKGSAETTDIAQEALSMRRGVVMSMTHLRDRVAAKEKEARDKEKAGAKRELQRENADLQRTQLKVVTQERDAATRKLSAEAGVNKKPRISPTTTPRRQSTSSGASLGPARGNRPVPKQAGDATSRTIPPTAAPVDVQGDSMPMDDDQSPMSPSTQGTGTPMASPPIGDFEDCRFSVQGSMTGSMTSTPLAAESPAPLQFDEEDGMDQDGCNPEWGTGMPGSPSELDVLPLPVEWEDPEAEELEEIRGDVASSSIHDAMQGTEEHEE
jgi:hypothetical protein